MTIKFSEKVINKNFRNLTTMRPTATMDVIDAKEGVVSKDEFTSTI